MNLIENAFDLADEDADAAADRESDAQYAREAHVEKLIRYAFSKIGLPINYNNYSISYEDSTREAEVTLEDQEVTLADLTKLIDTGLAEGAGLSAYKVVWGSDALSVHFRVAAAIDQAQIPTD